MGACHFATCMLLGAAACHGVPFRVQYAPTESSKGDSPNRVLAVRLSDDELQARLRAVAFDI